MGNILRAGLGDSALIGGLGGLLLPVPALASSAVRFSDVANGAALGGITVAAAGLCIFLALRLRREQRQHADRLARQANDGDRLLRLVASDSNRFGCWFEDDRFRSVSGLGAWLGLAVEPKTFGELEPAFASSDFVRLSAAVATLRDTATAFHIEVADGKGRSFVAEGRGDGRFAVVSFADVTAQVAEREARREAMARANHAEEILEALPIPVWYRDGGLVLTWCNAAYAAIVEAVPAAIIAQQIELASGGKPEQPLRLAARVKEHRQTGKEVRHLVVGGDRRAIRVSEMPLASGGTIGFAEDVTDLERVGTDLKHHIEAHGEVLQNLTTAIGVFGPDRRLLLFNHAFAHLWRLDEDWLTQAPNLGEILELLREKRRLPEQANWQTYKKTWLQFFTEVIEPKEELMHLPDERTLRLCITPHPFGGLLFTFEDVTNELVLERARNTLIAVQRATLDNLYEGVAVYGGDGRLKLWNPAFGKIWKLDDKFLDSEPHITDVADAIRDLVNASDDWPNLRERMLSFFGERRPRSGRIERPNGSVLDFAMVPLPDGETLFTYLDVSDSIRIERALRERNEALQAADRLKSEFVANVSYELRTPLNTIIGFAEIITNQYFGELNRRQLEYARGILDSSHHLLLLVNDILDLATIESGHIVLEREPFDLHATFVTVLGLTRDQARRQDLTIEFDCPADIGWIDADERRIKQVLFNLMSNAMKFTSPGGTIGLGATRTPDEIVIWVSDTGIGIPFKERERVFQRFYKTRAGAHHAGTGLGLSLVQSFIELHGGSVELHSEPDRGTTVRCYLPLTPTADRRPTISAEVPEMQPIPSSLS